MFDNFSMDFSFRKGSWLKIQGIEVSQYLENNSEHEQYYIKQYTKKNKSVSVICYHFLKNMPKKYNCEPFESRDRKSVQTKSMVVHK
jgi:hypothetical protein